MKVGGKNWNFKGFFELDENLDNFVRVLRRVNVQLR